MRRKYPKWFEEGHIAAVVRVAPSNPDWWRTNEQAYPDGFVDLEEQYDIRSFNGGVTGSSLAFHNYKDARDFIRKSRRQFPEVPVKMIEKYGEKIEPSASEKYVASRGSSRHHDRSSLDDVTTAVYAPRSRGEEWTMTDTVMAVAVAAIGAFVAYKMITSTPAGQ